MKRYELLLSGIGGQGIITLSQIIADAAMECGINLNVTQDRGLAQRGGTVRGQIRMGDVYSPLIPKKSLHTLLALEMESVLNYTDLFSDDTVIIINDNEDNPEFRETVIKSFEPLKDRLFFIPARKTAEEMGLVKAFNIYILGVAYGKDEKIRDFITEDAMINSIRKNIRRSPEKNLEMFKQGIEIGKGL